MADDVVLWCVRGKVVLELRRTEVNGTEHQQEGDDVNHAIIDVGDYMVRLDLLIKKMSFKNRMLVADKQNRDE